MAASFYVRFVDGEIFRCFALPKATFRSSSDSFGSFDGVSVGLFGTVYRRLSVRRRTVPVQRRVSAFAPPRSLRSLAPLRPVKNLGKILHFPP